MRRRKPLIDTPFLPSSQCPPQVAMYGHTLNREQWLSVLLVFVGLSGEVYDKYEKKKAKKEQAGKKE